MRRVRFGGMGFSITNGISNLGALAIVLLISAVAIVIAFLFASTRQARRNVLDEDVEHKGPEF